MAGSHALSRDQRKRKPAGAFPVEWKPICGTGSVNVGATNYQWDEILQLIDVHKSDVLMMQETRTSWNEMRGLTAKMRMEGWKVFVSDAKHSKMELRSVV